MREVTASKSTPHVYHMSDYWTMERYFTRNTAHATSMFYFKDCNKLENVLF